MKTDTKIVLKNVFGELVLSFAFMEIHLLMQCLSYRRYKIAQLCVRGISQPCVTSGYLYMKLKKKPVPRFHVHQCRSGIFIAFISIKNYCKDEI